MMALLYLSHNLLGVCISNGLAEIANPQDLAPDNNHLSGEMPLDLD